MFIEELKKVDPAGTSRLVWSFGNFAEPFGWARSL